MKNFRVKNLMLELIFINNLQELLVESIYV